MNKIFIKPAEGLKVYNPFRKRLIEEAGESVNTDTYWLRLAKQGDITITEVEEDKKGNKKS